MKILRAAFGTLYCLYAFLLFVALMLCVIPFVVAGSFFGKIRGGNFIYRVCTIWADIWMFAVGIFHRNIYEVPHDPKRQYIFVANHISYLDAPVIVRSLRQRVRVLGKVEMAHIPVFGFIYRHAIVTVDRSSAGKRARSVRILKSVLNKGISIFIFPEGTFNESGRPLKAFYDGAFRIALETRTPIKPLLFLHTHDRMPHRGWLTLNPGPSRTIFLAEIPVDGYTTRDIPKLRDDVYAIMESRLRDYRAGWVNNS